MDMVATGVLRAGGDTMTRAICPECRGELQASAIPGVGCARCPTCHETVVPAKGEEDAAEQLHRPVSEADRYRPSQEFLLTEPICLALYQQGVSKDVALEHITRAYIDMRARQVKQQEGLRITSATAGQLESELFEARAEIGRLRGSRP